MKQKFSKKWKASKQPRKQRKYLANAPLHVRHKFMSANLSKELRKKYLRRSFPLRKEDRVKIMRGQFKGKTGKIETVNLKKLRVSIEGVHKTKKDGTKLKVYFHPSKLQIQELNLDDGKRAEALNRKIQKKEENKKEDKKIKDKAWEEKNVSKKTES